MSGMWGCYEIMYLVDSGRVCGFGTLAIIIYNTFESDSELTIFWFVDHNFFLP